MLDRLIEMAISGPQNMESDLDPAVKEVVESINPHSPRLLQAARILGYCGKKDDDLKTKLEACNTGNIEIYHAFYRERIKLLLTRLIFSRRRNFRAATPRSWFNSCKPACSVHTHHYYGFFYACSML